MVKLQRDKVKIFSKTDAAADVGFVSASPAECLSFVWELTKEVYSISGEYDVESRLQRHVVHII